MKRPVALLAAAVLAGSLPVVAQRSYTVPGPLSDKEVEAAIVLGRANKLKGIVQRCVAGAVSKAGSFAAFGVVGLAVAAAKENKSAVYEISAVAAAGRIATSAWASAQANQPFTLASVEADWRLPVLQVIVSPQLPTQDRPAVAVFPLQVKALSIKSQSSPGRTVVSIPTEPLVSVPRTWRNVSGATVDYTDTVSRFDLHLLERVTGESVEFVISTAEAGDRTCSIRPDDLKELIRIK